MVVVVYVVVTTVVLVAGAKENCPMVACESLDFGRLRTLWPWLLEAISGGEGTRRMYRKSHYGLALVRVSTSVKLRVFVRILSALAEYPLEVVAAGWRKS